MSKKFSRRDFLKSSLLGSGAFFLSLSPLQLFGENATNTSVIDNAKNKAKAASLNSKAKTLFYQKKYAESGNIYKQLIAEYPGNVSYYDGYAKVFKAQQKTLETAELYKEGLKANPKKAVFMQRLSLSIQMLCMGNRKAEKEFIAKYGDALLFESSIQLLFDAINLHPKNKSLYLHLMDIQKNISTKNEWLTERKLAIFEINSSLHTQINSITSSYKKKWEKSRAKHKPNKAEDVDTAIASLKVKDRRELYTLSEKQLRDKAKAKTKKEYLKTAFSKHLQKKDINKVDKYGMLILSEHVTDTDTIGKMRKLYKNNKAHDRLIALNRYLYINHESAANALALATALAYRSNNPSEAVGLLDKVYPHVSTLHSTAIAGYYLTRAQVYIQRHQLQASRTCLLEGLQRFYGKGEVTFSLIESYAHSLDEADLSKGEMLLKALCGQTVEPIDDEVWKYVHLYLFFQKEDNKVVSIMEQIKQLTALSKIQQRTGSNEYSSTLSQIKDLKQKVRTT